MLYGIDQECSDCGIATAEKLEKLVNIVSLLRDPKVDYPKLLRGYLNKLADMDFPVPIPQASVQDTEDGGPDCSVAFYI